MMQARAGGSIPEAGFVSFNGAAILTGRQIGGTTSLATSGNVVASANVDPDNGTIRFHDVSTLGGQTIRVYENQLFFATSQAFIGHSALSPFPTFESGNGSGVVVRTPHQELSASGISPTTFLFTPESGSKAYVGISGNPVDLLSGRQAPGLDFSSLYRDSTLHWQGGGEFVHHLQVKDDGTYTAAFFAKGSTIQFDQYGDVQKAGYGFRAFPGEAFGYKGPMPLASKDWSDSVPMDAIGTATYLEYDANGRVIGQAGFVGSILRFENGMTQLITNAYVNPEGQLRLISTGTAPLGRGVLPDAVLREAPTTRDALKLFRMGELGLGTEPTRPSSSTPKFELTVEQAGGLFIGQGGAQYDLRLGSTAVGSIRQFYGETHLTLNKGINQVVLFDLVDQNGKLVDQNGNPIGMSAIRSG